MGTGVMVWEILTAELMPRSSTNVPLRLRCESAMGQLLAGIDVTQQPQPPAWPQSQE